MTGFIFKIQANMDPKPGPHRLSCGFVGHAEARLEGAADPDRQANSAQCAAILLRAGPFGGGEAWAGDIVGIPNHGSSHW